MAIVESRNEQAVEVKGGLCDQCGLQWGEAEHVCPLDGTPLSADDGDPLIGNILDEKYEVLALIGKGGMSVVYKARHVFMRRIVAVKIMRRGYVQDKATVKRFQQEAKAVAALDHPNIMKVYDFNETPEGMPFLVIDFVEGAPLSSILDQVGMLPVPRAVDLFMQVCDGLAHAHENGLIHRDIKPSNLMIARQSDGQMQVKIVDFGLVKVLPESSVKGEQLTLKGEVFGTTLYMSPEQCMGRKVDSRSDIYSFGCVMYEALTGLPPLVGDNPRVTMVKHVSEAVAPLRATRAEIPQPLEDAVLKTLHKDPAKRYQSFTELRTDLEKVLSSPAGPVQSAASAADAPAAGGGSDPRALWVVIALLLVLGVVAAFVVPALMHG